MVAKFLVDAIANSVISLAIREHVDEVINEIESVLLDPLNLFFKYSHWPSTLTFHGVPVELSIGIKNDSNHSFRYVVDIADYSQGMVNNWVRSLRFAKEITGIATDKFPQLWELFTKHMDGIPNLIGTTVYGGIGYSCFGLKKAELYFFKNWSSNAEFEERFPNYSSAMDRFLNLDGGPNKFKLEALEYEFTETGEMTSTKFLGWLDYKNSKSQFSEVAGHHPNLTFAGKVFDHFRTFTDVYQYPNSIALQLSLDQYRELHPRKIFFPCYAWSWISPNGFLDLVRYLMKTFSISLWQLLAVHDIFSEYKIPLHPTWVSIGPGESHPSIGFYFCPILEGVTFTNPAGLSVALPRIFTQKTKDRGTTITRDQMFGRLERIDEMISRGTDYILGMKETDGCWVDFILPHGMSDEWVTAYTTAALSKSPSLHHHLKVSIKWLQERFRPSEGWGYNRNTPTDADSTALAFLALHRMNVPLPEDAHTTLLRYRLPNGGYSTYLNEDLDYMQGVGPIEIIAGVLLTQLEAGLIEPSIIYESVTYLVSQKRGDGGWNSFWWKDDLFATCRVLNALNAFIRFATLDRQTTQIPDTIIQSAINAVKDMNLIFYHQTIPNEPFIMGLYLSSLLETQDHINYPRIDRILYNLYKQQQKDGRWLSVPIKRIKRTKVFSSGVRSDFVFHLDPKCLITTITVIMGLKAYYNTLKNSKC
ncbi:MAG: prenyltransferase/squalene oxidase repeat-containing protein [Candidatus Hodarchaeota archaeon]